MSAQKNYPAAWLAERSAQYRVIALAAGAVAALGYVGASLGFDEFAWGMHAGVLVAAATVPLLLVNAIDLLDARRAGSRVPEARTGSTTRPTAASMSGLPRRARRRAGVACCLLAIAPLALLSSAAMVAAIVYGSSVDGQSQPLIDVDLVQTPLLLGGTGALAFMVARFRSIESALADLLGQRD